MIHGDDTLSANSFSVEGTRADGEVKAYMPVQLARHLDKERLTKPITDIRLAVCNGGRADDVGDSFASIFKGWMAYHGYRTLPVYGYVGNVRAGRLELHDGEWIKYSRISRIDPNGIQIDKFYRLSKQLCCVLTAPRGRCQPAGTLRGSGISRFKPIPASRA